MKTLNYNIDLELQIEVESFIPPRSAPACSNPSSSAYSDMGDDAEIEYKAYLVGEVDEMQESGKYRKVKVKIPAPDDFYEIIDGILWEEMVADLIEANAMDEADYKFQEMRDN